MVAAMADTTAVGAEVTVAKKRAPKEKFETPDGWIARGFMFEVAPARDEDAAKVRSHFGGRRYAYNWALGQVKADMDAPKADPAHASVPWNLYALRKRFNAEKAAIAPWWQENSKEAYATGIADLCTALKNWSDSKSGKRRGRSPASLGSGRATKTRPECALRPGLCGFTPTDGPSPCRWWGHSARKRAPDVWSAW